jgi:hypothetical protein
MPEAVVVVDAVVVDNAVKCFLILSYIYRGMRYEGFVGQQC